MPGRAGRSTRRRTKHMTRYSPCGIATASTFFATGAFLAAAFFCAAHLALCASAIFFLAAALIRRRPRDGFGAGAAALRLAAHRAFIKADRRLRPAGVRPRLPGCFGAALAAVAGRPRRTEAPVLSRASTAAMARAMRLRSALRPTRILRSSMCSPSAAIVTISCQRSKSRGSTQLASPPVPLSLRACTPWKREDSREAQNPTFSRPFSDRISRASSAVATSRPSPSIICRA